MKIKCDVCGKLIDEESEVCPQCGAVLKKKKPKASDKPKTINELKAWYEARNLPPYETTRFFIGINYTKPRAFGIYQEDDKFIVYKNKNDGSRAIRYEGNDEEYAVNELYLRLKDEIKNQKNNNSKRIKKQRKTVFAILGTFFGVFALITGIGVTSTVKSERLRESLPQTYFYYIVGDDIYYCDSGEDYEWWKYYESIGDYALLTTLKLDRDNPEKSFPVGVSKDDTNEILMSYLCKEYKNGLLSYEEFSKKYDIDRSKNYLDYNNEHSFYDEGYYQKEDRTFYHLNNHYTGSYKYKNGWYEFIDNAWVYYCDDNDSNAIGEDIWYRSEDYYCGESLEDYKNSFNESQRGTVEETLRNIQDFQETDYYNTYQDALDKYNIEKEAEEKERESSSFWSSSDSDYDWDSSDSWDSGSTDFDSDW